MFEESGKQTYPSFLGHYGDLNNNAGAKDSQIEKLHIALSDADYNLKTWRSPNGYHRTCDNFLVYVRHYFHDEYYQILDIVTPNAHTKIDSIVHVIIDYAEKFHSLELSSLKTLPFYTVKGYNSTSSI
ncbi:type II toxin-antitoxin system YafO family toxin [Gallibacterium trehalosifermentans]|uniref:Type II toxin-antitoxin system YafO family toxin n=1 Tax=Gallibacterium trehalosifermentans TaxID=516935 RepID=A0ABV6GY67_9PAST